jgi:esterase/lipase superfamily enzyme
MATLYFGTNRNPNRQSKPDNFGKDFNADGLGNLRFGRAVKTPDGFDIELARERLVKDKKRKQRDGKGSQLGSLQVFDEVRQEMKGPPERDTIVYIHGYNVTFKQALSAALQMKKNFESLHGGAGVNVVLFSWPSDGSMMPYLAYSSDRQDAVASGPAFARGFLKLADFLRGSTPEEACSQHLHLVAHSMGNYVLRHALQEIVRQSPGRPVRLFDQVFLMAADEDDDAFERDYKLKFLPRLAKRVNVYFNNGDKGMAVSDKTKGNPDRLGDDGPRLPRAIPGKVSLIDCTGFAPGLVQHSYYVESQTVVSDMMAAMDGTASNKIKNRDYDVETNRYRFKKDLGSIHQD